MARPAVEKGTAALSKQFEAAHPESVGFANVISDSSASFTTGHLPQISFDANQTPTLTQPRAIGNEGTDSEEITTNHQEHLDTLLSPKIDASGGDQVLVAANPSLDGSLIQPLIQSQPPQVPKLLTPHDEPVALPVTESTVNTQPLAETGGDKSPKLGQLPRSPDTNGVPVTTDNPTSIQSSKQLVFRSDTDIQAGNLRSDAPTSLNQTSKILEQTYTDHQIAESATPYDLESNGNPIDFSGQVETGPPNREGVEISSNQRLVSPAKSARTRAGVDFVSANSTAIEKGQWRPSGNKTDPTITSIPGDSISRDSINVATTTTDSNVRDQAPQPSVVGGRDGHLSNRTEPEIRLGSADPTQPFDAIQLSQDGQVAEGMEIPAKQPVSSPFEIPVKTNTYDRQIQKATRSGSQAVTGEPLTANVVHPNFHQSGGGRNEKGQSVDTGLGISAPVGRLAPKTDSADLKDAPSDSSLSEELTEEWQLTTAETADPDSIPFAEIHKTHVQTQQNFSRDALADFRTDVIPPDNPLPGGNHQQSLAHSAEGIASPISSAQSAPVLPAVAKPEFGNLLVNQVVESIVAESEPIKQKTEHSISLQIDPAELGKLEIHVHADHDGMKAQIVATELLTSEMLAREKQQLISTLQEMGIELGDFEISHRTTDQNHQDNESSMNSELRRSRFDSREEQEPGDGSSNKDPDSPRRSTQSNSTIDVVA
jgi:hypothetical protein